MHQPFGDNPNKRFAYKALKEALRCYRKAWSDRDKKGTKMPKPVNFKKHYANFFKARFTRDPSVDKRINEQESGDDGSYLTVAEMKCRIGDMKSGKLKNKSGITPQLLKLVETGLSPVVKFFQALWEKQDHKNTEMTM